MPNPRAGAEPGARGGGAGLDITTERDGATLLLTLRGELDLHTVPRLRRRLAHAVERERGPVVIDLDGVSFIDSTGLSALLNALRRLTRAGRPLVLACGDGCQVRRILKLTRLEGTFAVRDTARQALAAVQERAAA